ncbi:hypothetical protein [Sanguibacter suaedae]|uniref:Adhesin domain-containing protein n=1 Tax=Sanguibacter suaedae TaxID=2795737 RepID=A0A934IFJ1_9MICO|nr:hypothetical protein [Sanguibacter suaedae]MBI9116049.1 hypothetical protein [Sanguibacter suaedae]
MRNETWIIAAPGSVTTELRDTGHGPAGADGPIPADVAPTSVTVAVTGGSVRVEAHDGQHAELEVLTVSSRPLAMTLVDTELRVSYEFAGLEGVVDRVKGLRDKDSVDVVLRVPATAELRVTAVSAGISVRGLAASVTASTVQGDVELDDVSGTATVSTVAGAVRAADHAGAVVVRTGTGAVDVAGELTRAEVATVSGAVLVSPGSGPSSVAARTVTAPVTVRAPRGVAVDLRTRTVNGRTVLDGSDLRTPDSGSTAVDHAEPGATVFVSTSTVSGDVVVSRAS